MNLRCPKCGDAYLLDLLPVAALLDCPGCQQSFSIDDLLATSAVAGNQGTPRELRPGSQFGHFTIHGQITPEHETYVAEDVRLREKVTLNMGVNYTSHQTFINRAFTVSRIRDPKISTVREVGRASDTPYVVLDPVEGETLETWIEQNKPSDQQLCKVFEQVASALEVIHENGLIHRRLNMNSVRIDKNANAKITDLLISQGSVESQDSTQLDQLDRATCFLAPEVRRGESASVRSDIYALGAMMRRAFELRDANIDTEGHDDFRFSRNAVVSRCMANSAKNRYRSAMMVADDLERISDGLRPRDADIWATIKRYLGRLLDKNWVGFLAIPAIVLVAIAFQNLNAPVTDFKDTQSVLIYAEEVKDAKIVAVPVFVPSSPSDGQPVVHLRATASGYYEGELEPGLYCLEIQMANKLPFCVFRRVPSAKNNIKTAENSTRFSRLPTGQIELAGIELGENYWEEDGTPSIEGLEFSTVPDSIVDSTFENPSSPENGLPEKYFVQEFEMSTTEVTWDVYSRVMGVVPEGDLNAPVTGITYHQALQFCELTRTRLPMQIEFVAALTKGGETPPRLNLPPQSLSAYWKLGPVMNVIEDRTDHDKPIYGLYSNAFELSGDCVHLSIAVPMPGIAPEMAKVYGGPSSLLVTGALDPGECVDVKKSMFVSLHEGHKKVGFRVVKSTKPRFRGFRALAKNSPN